MNDHVSSPRDEDHPVPRSTLVAAIKVGDRWVTAITRTWHAGDPIRCRLCPRDQCGVNGDMVCMVMTGEFIPPGEAYRYARPGALAAGGDHTCPCRCQTRPPYP